MITSAFLYLIYTFIYALISPLLLFNNVATDSRIVSAVVSSSSYLSAFSDYLPMFTIFAILGALLIFEGLLAGYKVIKWIYSKVPGIN